jgi:hypothetical protein
MTHGGITRDHSCKGGEEEGREEGLKTTATAHGGCWDRKDT